MSGNGAIMIDDTYPEINSDRDRLIQNEGDNPRPSCFRRHKWTLIVLVTTLFILAGHTIAIWAIYFRCTETNGCVGIKVMALNTWGMPATFGSKYKTERMQAIAEDLHKGEYDIYMFEELWMQPDHDTIASKVPEGYHITGFRQLALSDCDGRVAPTFCSGLAIVSKYPFVEVEFNSYTWHGDAKKMWIDGEYLAKKGVGRVRVNPLPGVNLDVFVTHTAADPDPSHGYNNSYYRIRQVDELMDTYIAKATGDVIFLAGDFNAGPKQEEGEVYKKITKTMKNCIEEIFYKLNRWLNPDYATYGNRQNTFSRTYSPVIYDYIFHRTNENSSMNLNVWTYFFEVPFLKTWLNLDKKKEQISVSDHEAVTTTIYIKNLR